LHKERVMIPIKLNRHKNLLEMCPENVQEIY